jgi:hypothetical protein
MRELVERVGLDHPLLDGVFEDQARERDLLVGLDGPALFFVVGKVLVPHRAGDVADL